MVHADGSGPARHRWRRICGAVLLGSLMGCAGCGTPTPTTQAGVQAVVTADVVHIMGRPRQTRALGLRQLTVEVTAAKDTGVPGYAPWDLQVGLDDELGSRPLATVERDTTRLLRAAYGAHVGIAAVR